MDFGCGFTANLPLSRAFPSPRIPMSPGEFKASIALTPLPDSPCQSPRLAPSTCMDCTSRDGCEHTVWALIGPWVIGNCCKAQL